MSDTPAGTRSPEEIRREIEETRADLGTDINELEYKVDPSRIRQQKTYEVKRGVRDRWSRVTDSVMGSRQDVGRHTQSAQSRAGDLTDGAKQTLTDAPERARQQAQGNPLAAGLIAFGGGMLLAALLPATEKEQQAAQELRDRYAEPVKEELKSVGQQAREELQPKAQEAAERVKGTAQEGAQHTREEAQGTAQQLQGEAKERAQQTRES